MISGKKKEQLTAEPLNRQPEKEREISAEEEELELFNLVSFIYLVV